MAIDGRSLADPPKERERAAYDSVGVRVLSAAIVWVPLGVIVIAAYVTGTWIGGVAGGVWSVASTVLTGVGVWVYRRYFRRHRRA